jgi:hypothetical protein
LTELPGFDASNVMSGSSLMLDKGGKTANIIECVSGDFIVFDYDSEALLERDDHVHHRHRVQLGKASEQWRGGVEQSDTLTEIQRFTQDYLDFFDYRCVQFSAKSFRVLRDEALAPGQPALIDAALQIYSIRADLTTLCMLPRGRADRVGDS